MITTTIYDIDHSRFNKEQALGSRQEAGQTGVAGGAVDLSDIYTDERLIEQWGQIIPDWVSKGDGQQRNEGMQDIWKNNAYYYEGYQSPVGFSADVLQKFAQNNTFVDTNKYKLKRDEDTGKVFVIDNKIKDAIDGQIGDYTSVKKEIGVDMDDIDSNDNIEYAVKKSLEYIQNRKQVWEQTLTPCIAGLGVNGLWWYAPMYNPRVNLPYGDIRFEDYHPQDVLVDPQAMKKYFLDARWVIRKVKIPIEEAYEYVRRFTDIFTKDQIQPDSDYYSYGNEYHEYMTGHDELYMTVFICEYKKQELKKVMHHGAEVEEEITRYFKILWNSNLKILHWAEDKYANVTQGDQWQFEVIPFYNQKNRLRQYPNSDIEKLSVIQDLINISETLLLDNARQRNLLRMIVRKQLYDNYPDEFEDFVKSGGILPLDDEELGKAFQQTDWKELPKQFYDFLGVMKDAFQEHGAQNTILQGAYPAGGSVSKPIIDGLKELRARHFTYKEENIQWAVSQGFKRIFRIIAKEWTDENFLKVTNRSKDDPKYIPINAIMTLADYESLLARVYPGMEIEQAGALFEEKNEVAVFKPKQLPEGWYVNQMGRLITDVAEVKAGEMFVFINMLSLTGGDRIDITVTMDWDYEKNKQENMIKAMEFSKGGKITDEELFKNSGDYWRANASDLVEKKKAENAGMMMAEQIQQRGPEAMKLVQGALQQYDMAAKEQAKGSRKREFRS